MVSEHLHRGFEADWIGGTFSMMITFNGIVAILAGFIAQGAADQFAHPVAPFDVSALFLIVGTPRDLLLVDGETTETRRATRWARWVRRCTG